MRSGGTKRGETSRFSTVSPNSRLTLAAPLGDLPGTIRSSETVGACMPQTGPAAGVAVSIDGPLRFVHVDDGRVERAAPEHLVGRREMMRDRVKSILERLRMHDQYLAPSFVRGARAEDDPRTSRRPRRHRIGRIPATWCHCAVATPRPRRRCGHSDTSVGGDVPPGRSA